MAICRQIFQHGLVCHASDGAELLEALTEAHVLPAVGHREAYVSPLVQTVRALMDQRVRPERGGVDAVETGDDVAVDVTADGDDDAADGGHGGVGEVLDGTPHVVVAEEHGVLVHLNHDVGRRLPDAAPPRRRDALGGHLHDASGDALDLDLDGVLARIHDDSLLDRVVLVGEPRERPREVSEIWVARYDDRRDRRAGAVGHVLSPPREREQERGTPTGDE